MEVRIAWTTLATLIAVCCLATELSPVAANSKVPNNCRPPSIQKQGAPKGYYIDNAKVTIPCIAKGDGKLTYRWTKNGDDLNLSSDKSKRRMSMTAGTGSLVIYKAKKEDAGAYQCHVSNSCGKSLSVVAILLHATMKFFPQVKNPEVIRNFLGSSVKLTCKPPFSVPKASVTWILMDAAGGVMTIDEDNPDEGVGFQTVELDKRVTMDYDGNLYITSLRNEDEHGGKTYVCMAQNKLTRASMKGEDKKVITNGVEVNTMGVGLMWHSETKNLVLQGKRARFKCIFSGQPEPTITWTRESGGEWDDERMTTDHHELIIKEVQYADAGKYKCSGVNSLDPKDHSHTFTLDVEAAPQWRVTPRNVDAGVQESASFDCDAVGNPQPSVQWFVNGKPYSKDSSKGVLNGNTLNFVDLEEKDSQVIQCNASNIYGYVWSDVYLFVQALPPTILTKPKDELIVARDTNVTLTCEVTGKPKPKVVWYKGKQPLNHERFVVQDNGNLFVQGTTMRDKGLYICEADNDYGHESASGTLTVRDKTQIVTKPVSEKVDYTNQVTFTCGAKTDNFETKNLRIRWLKDGAPLNESDERIAVTSEGLTILDTKSKDTGAYTCVAENGLDSDTATATLEVRAPPDPPYNVVREECLGKGATLSWRFDGKMRNFETMVRFIVESKNEYSPNTWTKIHSVNYPTTTTSFSLSPYAQYWFRVRAVNKMGVGEPSKAAANYCKTLMAAPDKNPENVRTDTRETGWLVIKWDAMEKIELNGEKFQYEIEIQDMKNGGEPMRYNVTDHTKDEFRMKVPTIYSQYLIRVRARNQAGLANNSPNPVPGYSGESVPTVVVNSFELDPDVNVTATMAGFRWSPVDDSPEAINGKFQGYKIRYWKKGQKDSTMHQEVIPDTREARRKRDVDDDGYVRGLVMNLPSFSEIVADVVVINTNFESEGSNKINLTTPEGVPGPVEFLEALNRGSNHIKVFWSPPPHPNGVLKGYQLSYRKIDSLDFGDVIIVNDQIPPEDERHTITGLEEDSQYRIYIKARTDIGWGKDYFIDIVTASELMVLFPPEIDNVKGDLVPPKIEAVQALDNEANVTWTLELSEEGDRIGYTYFLQHKKKGADKWTTSVEPIEDRLWANLDHLDPGTTYKVRVIAMDVKNQKREPSEAHMFRTSGVAPTTKIRKPRIEIIVRRVTRNTGKAIITPASITTTPTSTNDKVMTSASGEADKQETVNMKTDFQNTPAVSLLNMTTTWFEGSDNSTDAMMGVAVSGGKEEMKGQKKGVKEEEEEPEYTLAGAARASFLSAAWFIGMMIAIAVLILILIIVCIVKRNRGDNYPVQEKERLRGNCDDNHDHFNGFGKGSDENGIGVSSSFDRDGEKVPLDVDADSMDYGDDDASRFNEDGSFIGQYGRGDKSNDVANASASSIV